MQEYSNTPALLEMRNIAVAFGAVRILHAARLQVRRGEIHALLGENGAGKSSLVKVLFGLYPKKSGTVLLRGAPVEIHDPEQALAHGIAMIHQELPFATHLSVADNLFLGREQRKGPLGLFVDEARQHAACREILRPFPVELDPAQPLSTLSIAQQQIVAIARALSTGADLIVLDESTTALTDHETQRLFQLLRNLKAAGKTFIMITHKLDEVYAVADRATVMRDGETVAVCSVAETTPHEIVRHMVGRPVQDLFPTRTARPKDVRLAVSHLTTRRIRDVSFTARAGEVVGVAGLMGAGRTELFNALFGVDPILGGEIRIDGAPVTIRSPEDAIAHGMAYVTEDRKRSGLALDLGVEDNITLASLDRHVRLGMVRDRPLRRLARRFVEKLAISAKTMHRVRVLSGGNQQKVVLAKWLATGADVFLLDEPTRGIDVGTKQEVYALIDELTRAGKTVLLVTSELPELMAMSDRFLVFSGGRLVRALSREEATPEKIILYASTKPEEVQGSSFSVQR